MHLRASKALNYRSSLMGAARYTKPADECGPWLRSIPSQEQSTTAKTSGTMDCFAFLAITNYRFRRGQSTRRANQPKAVEPFAQKYSPSAVGQIKTIIVAILSRMRGRWPSSRTLGWDAVDADVPLTNGTEAYGEVVWSRRPDAGVKPFEKQTLLRGDGGKKARSPRRARYKP